MNGAARHWLPAQGSAYAQQVDHLLAFLLAISGVVVLGIIILIVAFAWRYRRRETRTVWPRHSEVTWIEVTWIVVPALVFLFIFGWSARLFLVGSTAPKDSYDVLVVGQQWMWEFQHPDGTREIGELHVPVDQAVRLLMVSQDVIHSFFVPAFRVKQDVLPLRYTQVWFTAARAGDFRFHCAEFCGMLHASMGGMVKALGRQDFLAWRARQSPRPSPVAAGEALFRRSGCIMCHGGGPGRRAPLLDRVYGSEVRLSDGQTVIADESYLRRSIVEPAAQVVAGYPAIMPSFDGLFTERELMEIIAYLKSLGDETAVRHD